jgi:Fur family transcriptional regulator, iron response regulator
MSFGDCRSHAMKSILRGVGLRPTRQRMALGRILFSKGDRHITAETLYKEAIKGGMSISLATVYNTLHHFTEVGLLRQLAVDDSNTHFDTNGSQHDHFFVEDEKKLLDIQGADSVLSETPIPPKGYEIVCVDVVVRLRRVSR